jgi:hypothetical protein
MIRRLRTLFTEIGCRIICGFDAHFREVSLASDKLQPCCPPDNVRLIASYFQSNAR